MKRQSMSNAVAEAVEGVPTKDRAEVTREVVERERARIVEEKRRRRDNAESELVSEPAQSPSQRDIAKALAALDAFVEAIDDLPDPATLGALMNGEPPDEYRRAQNWLSTFRATWRGLARNTG